jgi:hypothetical protein
MALRSIGVFNDSLGSSYKIRRENGRFKRYDFNNKTYSLPFTPFRLWTDKHGTSWVEVEYGMDVHNLPFD